MTCARAVTRSLLALLLCSAACSDEVEVGENRRLPAASGGAAGDGAAAGSGGSFECVPTICQNQIYKCGDCWDNDQDGLTDAADPECLGPCDDREDSFYGGIPGQNNMPCRQDCYFDSDSGFGNDECHWSHRCDTLSVAPGYPPSGDPRCSHDPNEMIPGSSASCAELAETQSEMCLSTCGPLIPNGCDCFGCCELPSGSGRYVWLGSIVDGIASCDRAHIDDPTSCQRCTPVSGCFNPCDACEVCVGRPAIDSSSCTNADGPVLEQCAPGVQPCGREGQPLCAGPNQYCITGCCVTIPA